MLEKGAIAASQASPAFPNNGGEIIPSKGRRANICEAEAEAWQQAEGLFIRRRQDTAKQVSAALISPNRTPRLAAGVLDQLPAQLWGSPAQNINRASVRSRLLFLKN